MLFVISFAKVKGGKFLRYLEFCFTSLGFIPWNFLNALENEIGESYPYFTPKSIILILEFNS